MAHHSSVPVFGYVVMALLALFFLAVFVGWLTSLGKEPSTAGRSRTSGRREPFTLVFHDTRQGRSVAEDRDLVWALLAKHDRIDLVGQRYSHGPTADGRYALVFER